MQPQYPLPTDHSALQKLAAAQQAVADDRGCLTNAAFHAWRGATLLALGRTAEAIEPLERALLHDPELPGAQLDLAQALAAEGDTASARAFLADMRQRRDLPRTIGQVIERQLDILSSPPQLVALAAGWQSRWQVSAMGGAETNLNNAPSSSEVTLTFPQGDVTLPLDIASRPRSGGATLGAIQWQGLRPWNESVLVVQADLKARQTGDSETSYQQSDVAATWLDAPAARRQWVARVARSHLRYGGTSLLRATRATLQYQWEAPERHEAAGAWSEALAGCRPAASLELEHRGYPESRVLDGVYQGGAAGWLCRRHKLGDGADSLTANTFFYGVQARVGSDRPLQSARAGGAYRRSEIRAQWEGPWLWGRVGAQWSTTHQRDRSPYSPLLGNVPRSTTRHVLQLEASWPLKQSLALVANAEISRQSSNLPVFDASQRSIYMGLRWEVMQ